MIFIHVYSFMYGDVALQELLVFGGLKLLTCGQFNWNLARLLVNRILARFCKNFILGLIELSHP